MGTEHPTSILTVASFGGFDDHVLSLSWSSDGKRLAANTDRSHHGSTASVFVLDPRDPSHVEPVTESNGPVIAWRPNTSLIAVVGNIRVTLVDATTGKRHLTGAASEVIGDLTWSPDGRMLGVTGSDDSRIFDLEDGMAPRQVFTISGSSLNVPLRWSPDMRYVAGLSPDGPTIWNRDGTEHRLLLDDTYLIGWIAWSPDGACVAHSADRTIHVYDARTWQREFAVEGHENWIPHFGFSPCGRLAASISWDQTLRLWATDDWRCVAILDLPGMASKNWHGFAFHPLLPRLAVYVPERSAVEVWELDADALLRTAPATAVERYTTAKVVLVGDSGVGKTGLAYRLSTGEFADHPSTHGQHFWTVNELGMRRTDGTECEVVLWDLAGQADYRLIHVLFLDDADAALLLIDPTRGPSSLDAVKFWVDALRRIDGTPPPTLLVGARSDRGAATLAPDELRRYAHELGIENAFISTSARDGDGVADVLARLTTMIRWDEMSAIVTTTTFRAIKDLVLALKQSSGEGEEAAIVTADELRQRLAERSDLHDVTDAELWTAVRNLEVHGYVRALRTATSERVILLQPELLNNLAASMVVAARRNEHGLGAIDEARAMTGDYRFPEMEQLPEAHGQLLLDAAIVTLLEHNVCFRETLGTQALLIFPELINERPPALAAPDGLVDDVTYSVDGNVENVYASLVVLLGYTNVLVRRDQWQHRAEYEMDGVRMGLHQTRPRPDHLELTLYYEEGTSPGAKRLFQGLIEQFLTRRNVTAKRYPRIECGECGFALDRAQVIRFVDEGAGLTFCPSGGHRIELPTSAEPIAFTDDEVEVIREQSNVASHRTRFLVALAQLRSLAAERAAGAAAPVCFVSYAWGDPDHERWVRRKLVPDLREASIDVVLDVDETRLGDSIARFVSRIEQADHVLAVGTPAYREKYENDRPEGTVVAAEVDLMNVRMLGSEQLKSTVIPVLRSGNAATSLPPLLRGRIFADLTDDADYFPAVFDLALKLWGIAIGDPEVSDLRAALLGRRGSVVS